MEVGPGLLGQCTCPYPDFPCKHAAALLVVGEGKGYGGLWDRYMDLRADDHPEPVEELFRLLSLHRLLFERPKERRPLAPEEVRWLQGVLRSLGLYAGEVHGEFDEATERAFLALIGMENLEERYQGGPEVDEATLSYLKRRYPWS
ncbi:putative peptidoglycan binding domain-containing protein [Thermus scotoductus]|uniref:putative peptidoglycan binding domain-containing protein n=1 Tax=Thermus scotoductus TaxID=37636 RepID=UPI003F5140EA